MNLQAKGDGFFVRARTRLYQPTRSLLGQIHDDSCVAACCRMLLQDQGLTCSETVVRAALGGEIGGVEISAAAQALEELGGLKRYAYRDDLSPADLQLAVTKGLVLAFVKSNPRSGFGHAVLVDSIKNGWVMIRDPWPLDLGSSYQVSLADFTSAWLLAPSAAGFMGRAVIVK